MLIILSTFQIFTSGWLIVKTDSRNLNAKSFIFGCFLMFVMVLMIFCNIITRSCNQVIVGCLTLYSLSRGYCDDRRNYQEATSKLTERLGTKRPGTYGTTERL